MENHCDSKQTRIGVLAREAKEDEEHNRVAGAEQAVLLHSAHFTYPLLSVRMKNTKKKKQEKIWDISGKMNTVTKKRETRQVTYSKK